MEKFNLSPENLEKVKELKQAAQKLFLSAFAILGPISVGILLLALKFDNVFLLLLLLIFVTIILGLCINLMIWVKELQDKKKYIIRGKVTDKYVSHGRHYLNYIIKVNNKKIYVDVTRYAEVEIGDTVITEKTVWTHFIFSFYIEGKTEQLTPGKNDSDISQSSKRLLELQDLLDRNLITYDEYTSRRKDIIDNI